MRFVPLLLQQTQRKHFVNRFPRLAQSEIHLLTAYSSPLLRWGYSSFHAPLSLSLSRSLACLLAWGMRAETLWPVGLPPGSRLSVGLAPFGGRSLPVPLCVPVRPPETNTPPKP